MKKYLLSVVMELAATKLNQLCSLAKTKNECISVDFCVFSANKCSYKEPTCTDTICEIKGGLGCKQVPSLKKEGKNECNLNTLADFCGKYNGTNCTKQGICVEENNKCVGRGLNTLCSLLSSSIECSILKESCSWNNNKCSIIPE